MASMIRKATPKAKKATPKPKVNKAETMLKNKIKSGKVKDLNATRQKIANRTGSWPNGMTN